MKTIEQELVEQNREILEEAVSLLEEYGWTQNELGSYGAGFCAAGAVMQACERLGLYGWGGESIHVLSLLDMIAPVEWEEFARSGYQHTVVWYNNNRGRTKEEVIDVFKKAIKGLVE